MKKLICSLLSVIAVQSSFAGLKSEFRLNLVDASFGDAPPERGAYDVSSYLVEDPAVTATSASGATPSFAETERQALIEQGMAKQKALDMNDKAAAQDQAEGKPGVWQATKTHISENKVAYTVAGLAASTLLYQYKNDGWPFSGGDDDDAAAAVPEQFAVNLSDITQSTGAGNPEIVVNVYVGNKDDHSTPGE